MNQLLDFHVDRGFVFYVPVAVLVALSFVLLPVFVASTSKMRIHSKVKFLSDRIKVFMWQLLAFLLIGAIGWVVVWLLSDVFVIFGVSLGLRVFIRISATFAFIGYAVCSAFVYRGWRKVIASVLIPIALLVSVLQVNAVYGQYPTIRSILDIEKYPLASNQFFRKPVTSMSKFSAMVVSGKIRVPEHGVVRSVNIDNTRSHFKARRAVVYVPPAALTKQVPALPVMVMLSGQPGSPDSFFVSGGIHKQLDAYAHTHNGLAPIVISPDQLGNRKHNTLCADTVPYGKAETYLTKDVIGWIEKNLPVTKDHNDWAIGGFSQGGTCSVQLGPTYPQLFHHVIDISGEKSPHAGSVDNMINRFFAGDKKKYEEHLPVRAMKLHAPSNQTIIFAAGEYDTLAQSNAVYISAAAAQNGWSVQSILAHGSGHDWKTVKAATQYSIAQFGCETGMGERPNIHDYGGLTRIPSVKTR